MKITKVEAGSVVLGSMVNGSTPESRVVEKAFSGKCVTLRFADGSSRAFRHDQLVSLVR